MIAQIPYPLFLLSCPAGGKPDDITVLLSIVAEYTDWKRVWQCVYVCISEAGLSSRLPESSTCSPLRNALQPVGWWGGGGTYQHDARSLLRGWSPPVHHIFVFFLCFVLVLEQSRGKQAARTFSCWSWRRRRWVGRMKDAFQSPKYHCITSTLFRWCNEEPF